MTSPLETAARALVLQRGRLEQISNTLQASGYPDDAAVLASLAGPISVVSDAARAPVKVAEQIRESTLSAIRSIDDARDALAERARALGGDVPDAIGEQEVKAELAEVKATIKALERKAAGALEAAEDATVRANAAESEAAALLANAAAVDNAAEQIKAAEQRALDAEARTVVAELKSNAAEAKLGESRHEERAEAANANIAAKEARIEKTREGGSE